MMREMNYYFFFILLATAVPRFLCDCKMSKQDADNCGVKSMFFGNRNAVVPSNDAEMTTHCGTMRTGVTCLKDYADTCISGFPQQISQKLLGNALNQIDKRCNDPTMRAEFLHHVKCLHAKEKKEPLDICSDKHIVMMEKVMDMAEEDRMRASCCSFHKSRDCVLQKSKAICGKETADYWDDIIEQATDDSIEFACAEYNSLEKCDKHMPAAVWQPLKDIADSDATVTPKYKSIVSVVLEMIEKSASG